MSNEGVPYTQTVNSSGNEFAPFEKCYGREGDAHLARLLPGRAGQPAVPALGLAEGRDEVDEVDDLVVGERLRGHRHGPVEIGGGPGPEGT